MAKKKNKMEDNRYYQLRLLLMSGEISDLEREPEFDLISSSGAVVGGFKPDFKYKLLEPFLDFKKGDWIIEEFKGSEYQHSYTRRDYPLRRKHFIADYPEYKYIENINGRFKIPKPRFKKAKK